MNILRKALMSAVAAIGLSSAAGSASAANVLVSDVGVYNFNPAAIVGQGTHAATGIISAITRPSTWPPCASPRSGLSRLIPRLEKTGAVALAVLRAAR